MKYPSFIHAQGCCFVFECRITNWFCKQKPQAPKAYCSPVSKSHIQEICSKWLILRLSGGQFSSDRQRKTTILPMFCDVSRHCWAPPGVQYDKTGAFTRSIQIQTQGVTGNYPYHPDQRRRNQEVSFNFAQRLPKQALRLHFIIGERNRYNYNKLT